jgi:DNA-binding XRE family transcriptional regulator
MMKRVVPTPLPSDPLITGAAAFGAMVRAARTKSGMTLVDAALTLGVSKQTLGDLETANASVGLTTALKVAKELGVAVFAVPAPEREPVRRLIISSRQAMEEAARGAAGTTAAAVED